jgi:nucleotide-binding universal stress UspA family protein
MEGALQDLASRVAHGIEVEWVVMNGRPAEKIREFALGRNIDLIVMPTDESGRIRRQLFGTVATSMLQNHNCPVLEGVHAPDGETGGRTLYKKIACKLEPGALRPERLRWARDFAAAYNSSLSVVSVLPFLEGPGATPSVPENLRLKTIADAREQIQSLCDQEAVDAEITVLGGAIDQVLPSFIRTNGIDLLVSGRERYQETLGVFGLRTDIVDTVQSVPCPMVLV